MKVTKASVIVALLIASLTSACGHDSREVAFSAVNHASLIVYVDISYGISSDRLFIAKNSSEHPHYFPKHDQDLHWQAFDQDGRLMGEGRDGIKEDFVSITCDDTGCVGKNF